MAKKTTLIGPVVILLLVFYAGADATQPKGIELAVERIEAGADGVEIFVRVANPGSEPVLMEKAGGGPPLKL